MSISPRLRAGTGALTAGLLLGVVPGLVATTSVANAAKPIKMTVVANHRHLAYGQSIVVAAHLGLAGRRVTYYEAYRGRSNHVIYRGVTDSRGNTAIRGRVIHSSRYTVVFSGGGGYSSAAASVTTVVRARVAIATSGGAKRKGYRLYGKSKRAVVGAAVGPNKRGQRVTFRLQVLRGHKYRTVDTHRYKLGGKSSVASSFRGKSGKRYRARAEYRGDSLNARANSKWVYVRFRR